MQLDAFVDDGKITSQPPPDLAFEDPLEPLPSVEEDVEERWMDEAAWLTRKPISLQIWLSETVMHPCKLWEKPSPPPEQNTVSRRNWRCLKNRLKQFKTSLYRPNSPLKKKRINPNLMRRTSALESSKQCLNR